VIGGARGTLHFGEDRFDATTFVSEWVSYVVLPLLSVRYYLSVRSPVLRNLRMERPSGVSKETQVSENKDEPVHCESSATIILDAPPSCIEFSRTAEDIFVVGTYSLVEAKDAGGSQARNGSLMLMRWDGEGLYVHTDTGAVIKGFFILESRGVRYLTFYPCTQKLAPNTSNKLRGSRFALLSP